MRGSYRKRPARPCNNHHRSRDSSIRGATPWFPLQSIPGGCLWSGSRTGRWGLPGRDRRHSIRVRTARRGAGTSGRLQRRQNLSSRCRCRGRTGLLLSLNNQCRNTGNSRNNRRRQSRLMSIRGSIQRKGSRRLGPGPPGTVARCSRGGPKVRPWPGA